MKSYINDERLRADDHVDWRHLIAHGVAFCAASAIAAIIFYPYYPRFQHQPDTASEAFWAFLTLCVIFGGMGPLITLLFFALQRLARRRRSAVATSRQRR